MPIYEFACKNGHRTEIIDLTRAYAETPSLVCTQCGSVAMRVAFSVTHWQVERNPNRTESFTSRAIRRVREADSRKR